MLIVKLLESDCSLFCRSLTDSSCIGNQVLISAGDISEDKIEFQEGGSYVND